MSTAFDRGVNASNIRKVKESCGVSHRVAKEMLILAGGDADLAIHCSSAADSLEVCKAMITDRRINRVEEGRK